jgi:pimeloyl-ACP methyl ester carboxylesterase
MTRWQRAPAVLLALAVLASCSSGGDGSAPHASSSSRPVDSTSAPTPDLARFYEQKVDWTDCKGGFECARVVVPVDYADPDGPTLRVAVNRLPASGDRTGALFVNPGGPGVSGLSYARSASSIVSKSVRERYDVVGFDPRGVGASDGLQCLTDRQLDTFIGYDGTPDDAGEEQGLLAQGELLAKGCQADDAALLAHMGTRDVARDLDVLRAVVGDGQLTYLGASYGTYLGAIYAELFPQKVGRLVLDGPIDPSKTGLELARQQGVGFQRALDAFLDDCVHRSSCPFSGDRAAAEQQLSRLFADIDGAPIRGVGRRRLTQSLAMVGTAWALYDKGSWSFLRMALARAERGDGEYLMLLADSYADRGPGGHYTSNANESTYAVNCVDRPEAQDLDEVRAAATEVAGVAPVFGPYIVWSTLPCSTWPVPPQGDAAPIEARGSNPILVVGTTRDPATPYEGAQALADQLDAGHLLTLDGDGHTAYREGSTCIDGAVDAFLLEGTIPAEGTRCR